MNVSAVPWPLVVSGLVVAIPVTLVGAALVSPRRAAAACTAALALTLGATLGLAAGHGAGGLRGVRVDVVTAVMLWLVGGIGLVIARYSRTYLHGAPQLARYQRWLLVTLAAVAALVVAGNLLVVALAWTATSLALHQLLTFNRDRAAALVAAHKKFLVSRLADACFGACLVLIQLSVGSLDLDDVAAWSAAHPALPPAMEAAAVLAVVAVALKSAQLPFHGWLTQVMEAPTPVSALLHAGVVNIGGLVLIRLAPWMAHAATAQLLLVLIGLTTAIGAALVMTTRVSVKVALAWSTCAQMGLMLVQCGLGAWDLALLHLVAHSLYKAHAFLSAGTAVDDWRQRRLAAPPLRPTPRRVAVALGLALGAVAVGVAALARLGVIGSVVDLPTVVLAVMVGLAVVPLLAHRGATPGRHVATGVGTATAVVVLYAAWHAGAARVMATAGLPSTAAGVGWVLVGIGVVVLFALKSMLTLWPDGRLARAWYPALFAGFYLDDRFTRLTFRIWPPRLPPPPPPQPASAYTLAEAP